MKYDNGDSVTSMALLLDESGAVQDDSVVLVSVRLVGMNDVEGVLVKKEKTDVPVRVVNLHDIRVIIG